MRCAGLATAVLDFSRSGSPKFVTVALWLLVAAFCLVVAGLRLVMDSLRLWLRCLRTASKESSLGMFS